MTDDTPIVPQDYIHGVRVVDIGDARVARGLARRPVAKCKHRKLVYSTEERRVYCEDCNTTVDTFDAFLVLVESFDKQAKRAAAREEKIAAAERHNLISLAAKAVDKAWRSSLMPLCPCCSKPLLPEDFKDGVKSSCGKSFARKQRGLDKPK